MPAQPELDAAASDFTRVRPKLFGIAYRVLGSVSDAEDIVQETWLRWQEYDRAIVREPEAFLATIATRLSINVARSARARRETYPGPWLPEPVDTSADPGLGAERAEALELAILQVMEKLTPSERGAYVLREAFDYPYSRIAEILEVTEANARQLVSRARKDISAQRREPADPERQRRLLSAFLAAAQKGDLADLEELFAADVISYADGGGVVRGAAGYPIEGVERVAKVVAAYAPRFWTGVQLTWAETNGRSSVLVSRDDSVVALITVGATAEGIDRLLWILNPAKIARMSVHL
ncbi:RNA polymerase sigma-70 factor [Pseudonocardia spinosispora]|uniref:RNA polymerase sigma-70 factor n=1 Tax=Pseudonocardia spinosispora TaxID=103441 RepID=UPI000418C084|nr:RNA polymerase sigma-70 factor [Pseudonocardia spinosispora]